ncbi:Hypothetical_protein [Hexamita inflata]|uniref:Hypothetical_protein n=1 Tax=Hexamita inflata TaxID=28002 RepID=A0AA86RDM3_9EUKA|nr:Hypothetical protein HINF_LOCUS59711 [Hexamita inflata]
MHDGSQTGKSTLQLAIFYAFLFHPDLTKTPIILNNSGGSRTQPLYYQNNLQIEKQIGSLNTNFKLQIEQTQNINVDSFINLVVANLNDFKAYPDNIVNLAQEIQNVLQTMQQIQIIAQATILKKDNILQNYSNNNINKILAEPYFNIIINIVIQLYSNLKLNTEEFLQITNSDIISFFLFINKYKHDKSQTPEPKIVVQAVILIDEISVNDIAIKKDSKIKLLNQAKFIIQSLSQNESEFMEIYTPKINILLKDSQYQNIFSILNTNNVLEIMMLIFPLSLFLKENSIVKLTTSPQFKILKSSSKWESNDVQDAMKYIFDILSELSDLDGFEALSYRDLLNAFTNLSQINSDFNQIFNYELIQQQIAAACNCCQNTEIIYQYSKQYTAGDIQCVLSGTNARMIDFVNYTMLLKHTGGSILRNLGDNIYLHIVSIIVPQLHASLLQQQYYKNGIGSVKFGILPKDISDSNLIFDIFQVIQANAISYIQQQCPAVSPQLVITDEQYKIIYSRTQETYLFHPKIERLLNKIKIDNYLNQLAICKQISKTSSTSYKISESYKSNLLIYYGRKKSVITENNSINIQIQPLSTSNQPVLANQVNRLIQELFMRLNEHQLPEEIINSFVSTILNNVKLVNKNVQIHESFCLLHFLSYLSRMSNVQQIISKVIEKINLIIWNEQYYQELIDINNKIVVQTEQKYIEVVSMTQYDQAVNILKASQIIVLHLSVLTFQKIYFQTMQEFQLKLAYIIRSKSACNKTTKNFENYNILNKIILNKVQYLFNQFFDKYKTLLNDLNPNLLQLIQYNQFDEQQVYEINFDLGELNKAFDISQDFLKLNIQFDENYFKQKKYLKDIEEYHQILKLNEIKSKQLFSQIIATKYYAVETARISKKLELISQIEEIQNIFEQGQTFLQNKELQSYSEQIDIQNQIAQTLKQFNDRILNQQSQQVTQYKQILENQLIQKQLIQLINNQTEFNQILLEKKICKPGYVIKYLTGQQQNIQKEVNDILEIPPINDWAISVMQPELAVFYNVNDENIQQLPDIQQLDNTEQYQQFIQKQLDIIEIASNYFIQQQNKQIVIIAIPIDNNQLKQTGAGNKRKFPKIADFIIGIKFANENAKQSFDLNKLIYIQQNDLYSLFLKPGSHNDIENDDKRLIMIQNDILKFPIFEYKIKNDKMINNQEFTANDQKFIQFELNSEIF